LTAQKKQVSGGDAPAAALLLAHDLSVKLSRRDVACAKRKVADWEEV
jgi:hypothetical protein